MSTVNHRDVHYPCRQGQEIMESNATTYVKASLTQNAIFKLKPYQITR